MKSRLSINEICNILRQHHRIFFIATFKTIISILIFKILNQKYFFIKALLVIFSLILKIRFGS